MATPAAAATTNAAGTLLSGQTAAASTAESAAIVPDNAGTRYDQVELITNRIRDGSSVEPQDDILDGSRSMRDDDDEEERRRVVDKARRRAARGERERRPPNLFQRMVRYGNDNFNNICSALSPLLIVLAYGANNMYFSQHDDHLFPDGSMIRKLRGIINCTALALEGHASRPGP